MIFYKSTDNDEERNVKVDGSDVPAVVFSIG